MELAYAYGEIEKRLQKLDFSALFRGFSRLPFALYNDSQAFMDGRYIEKTGDFLGNTSICLNGAHTAIWQLSGEQQDFDVLASKIVHEMLHAFQHVMGDTRWADERAALVKYRYDPENVTARLLEAACMEACLGKNDPEAFGRLLSLRKARMERFPYAYDYEARIEQIEGTANFVELETLAQLDAEKAKARWARTLAELSDPARYFPVRSVTYLSGAAFLACLRAYTTLDTDCFTDAPFAVAALKDARPCALPSSDPKAEACMEKWREDARGIVNEAIKKGEIVLDGAYHLVAWNVYDAQWDGTYAIINSFLGCLEGDMPTTDEELFARMKIIKGDFVAQVDESFQLSRVWRR